MTEYESSKLDHEKHLLLDQSLLRLPNELVRHNLKTAQIQIKATQDKVNETISTGTKNTAKAAATSPEDAAAKATASLDQAINRLQTLKRKLSALNESTQRYHTQSAARVRHLEDLYQIPSLADVKYDEWSRVRLDRLLADYLLRMGYVESARALAQEKHVTELVDCDAFEQCGKIERSLRVEKRVDAALAWCSENKGTLKKMGNNTLEYELRLQQFIELVRQGHITGEIRRFTEARTHAAKYLTSHTEPAWKGTAVALFAVPPPEAEEESDDGNEDTQMHEDNTTTPTEDEAENSYNALYLPSRWSDLASLFLQTHHTLFQLPSSPLLHMALTAGLSALKTPACHSKFLSPTSGLQTATSPSAQDARALSPPLRTDFSTDSVDGILSTDAPAPAAETPLTTLSGNICPICSTELNRLSKHLPFAHHGKSHIEPNPVMFPNGRVYGLERLERVNEKLGTPKGYVQDPMDVGRMWGAADVRKVYFL